MRPWRGPRPARLKAPSCVPCARRRAGDGAAGAGSPPGNVYSSTILRPPVPPAEAAQLSFVTALAVADTAAPLIAADHRVAIKWPNDVLVDDCKISGILLESAVGEGGLIGHVVIGVGINVASAPPSTRYGATFLAALGSTASTDTVFAAYIGAGTALRRVAVGRFRRHAGRMAAPRGVAGSPHRGLAGRDDTSRPLRRS